MMQRSKRLFLLLAIPAVYFVGATLRAENRPVAPPRLRVASSGRHLETDGGEPFFWMGDTAWRMVLKFARTDRPDQPSVLRYLDARAALGFNVVQTVIAGHGGEVNIRGHRAFQNGDWSRPIVVPGEGNDYWDDLDWLVRAAAARGLYLALLPYWLNSLPYPSAPDNDPSIAYRYGHFLGSRFGRYGNVIWILGGDAYRPRRNVENPDRLALTRALAEGIADGTNGVDHFDGLADWSTTLMSFHPPGGNRSSSEWLHRERWLDFNMIQTTTRFRFENYRTVTRDYRLRPPKPTLDGEVAYEGSLSLRRNEPRDRRISPWEVRRAAYWAVLAGACGHTYGHRSFIEWIRAGERGRHGAHLPWFEAIDAPGAKQVVLVRRLVESLPGYDREPAQELLLVDEGRGTDHVQVARDRRGRFVVAYMATGRTIAIDLAGAHLVDELVWAWWVDPRSGSLSGPTGLTARGQVRLEPPSTGEGQDWLIVIHADRAWADRWRRWRPGARQGR